VEAFCERAASHTYHKALFLLQKKNSFVIKTLAAHFCSNWGERPDFGHQQYPPPPPPTPTTLFSYNRLKDMLMGGFFIYTAK
jgi:hypothetical protein